MISIFQLWTFHLYVATFPQYLHIEHTPLKLMRYSRARCILSGEVEVITSKVTEYLCHKWPQICSVCRNHNSILYQLMTYNRFITRATWRISPVEQKLPTVPGHLSSLLVFTCIRGVLLFTCPNYMSSRFMFRVVMYATVSS
jgi:hypothetical protein